MLGLKQRIFDQGKSEEYISVEGAEVKILFSSENPALLGKTLETTAIEMSPRSIRMEVGYPIEIDSVLDIAVSLDNGDREYHLTGNVRYRLPSKVDKYQVVLVLRERTDIKSDLKAWKANFERNFSFVDVG